MQCRNAKIFGKLTRLQCLAYQCAHKYLFKRVCDTVGNKIRILDPFFKISTGRKMIMLIKIKCKVQQSNTGTSTFVTLTSTGFYQVRTEEDERVTMVAWLNAHDAAFTTPTSGHMNVHTEKLNHRCRNQFLMSQLLNIWCKKKKLN